MAKRTAPKQIPLSKWAKGALKRINEDFPPGTKEGKHPFVVFTRLLVLCKDCGINPFAASKSEKGK